MAEAIDLNADLGEGAGSDHGLLGVVSSASIACGGHAGDAATMGDVLARCEALGVRAGAHPGFADPAHFGRRRLDLDPAEVRRQITGQLAALLKIAGERGVPVAYVKLHGAMANMAAEDRAFAELAYGAVHAVAPDLAVMAMAGTQQVVAAEALGFALIREAYADRAYDRQGQLVARSEPGAVLHDPQAVAARCVRLVQTGHVRTITGDEIAVDAQSICLHGDTPGALAMAQAVRDALGAAGISVSATT